MIWTTVTMSRHLKVFYHDATVDATRRATSCTHNVYFSHFWESSTQESIFPQNIGIQLRDFTIQ